MKFKDWHTCYYCGKEMDDNDIDNYEPRICCSGSECGCMGLPTEPPYCIACQSEHKEQNDKVT